MHSILLYGWILIYLTDSCWGTFRFFLIIYFSKQTNKKDSLANLIIYLGEIHKIRMTGSKIYYSWPLNKMGVRDTNSLHSWKSMYNLQLALHIHSSCVSVISHPRVQPKADRLVLLYVFIEKHPNISGPMKFEPMLLEVQL